MFGLLSGGAIALLALVPVIPTLGWPAAAKWVVAAVAVFLIVYVLTLLPAKLILSDEGLCQTQLFSELRLRWTDIAEWRYTRVQDVEGFWVRDRAGKKHELTLAGIWKETFQESGPGPSPEGGLRPRGIRWVTRPGSQRRERVQANGGRQRPGCGAWPRRVEMVAAAGSFLVDKSADKVAGALQVLYRFRAYRPLVLNGPPGLGEFESDNAAFLATLDKVVYPHFDRYRQLKSESVDRALALYLGVSRTPEAKRELLQIARTPSGVNAKDQALICLAWHRDPADMATLLPFRLEDSPVARNLPYHFRNSYGDPALPYLRKALTEAKNEATRREAEKELKLLETKSRDIEQIGSAKAGARLCFKRAPLARHGRLQR